MAERTVPGEELNTGSSSRANSRPVRGNRIFLIRKPPVLPNTNDRTRLATAWRVLSRKNTKQGARLRRRPGRTKSEILLDTAKEKRNTRCDLRGGPCLRHSPQYSPLQNLRCLSFLNALNIAQTIGSQSLPSFAMARVVFWTNVVRRIALRRTEKKRIV